MTNKYIETYEGFLLEAMMQKSEWVNGSFKFTYKFLELLDNPTNEIVIKGNKRIKVSDIKPESLNRVRKFLTRLTKTLVKVDDDTFKKWFTNKKDFLGIELNNGTKIPLYFVDKTLNKFNDTKRGLHTLDHETVSMMFMEYAIEYNMDSPPLEKIEEVFPEYNDTWITAFQAQTKLIKQWVGNKRDYIYERETGMMKNFNATIVSLRKSNNANSWNPADIWLTHKTVYRESMEFLRKIATDNIDDNDIKVQKINAFLREKLLKKEIIPISLKKIKLAKELEEVNIDGAVTDLSKYSVEVVKADCDLNYEYTKGFINKSASFLLKLNGVKSTVVKIVYKEGSKARSTVSVNANPVNSSYQYGAVPIDYIDSYFEIINEVRPDLYTMPAVGKWNENDILFWIDIYQKILSSNFHSMFKINFGKVSVKEFEKNLRSAVREESYMNQSNTNIASSLCAKMQQLKYLYIYSKLFDVQKWDDFAITMILSAQKRFGDAGPFILLLDS